MRRLLPGLARRLDTLGLWVGLGVFWVVVGLSVVSTLALVDGATWVEHTHRVIESLDALKITLSEVTSSRRRFSMTDDAGELDGDPEVTERVSKAERRVRALTADNPGQQRRLDALEKSIGSGSPSHGDLGALIGALTAEERRLLAERERRTAGSVRHLEVLELVGAGVSFGLIAVVALRLRREIRRRERSELVLRESEGAVRLLNDDLERRVEARTAELTMANRELEEFSYSVVHDLRAPLRGIGGFAQVLLDESGDTLSADARDCLGEIEQNARRMAALIDALTSMSRIMRSPLSRASVDLSSLARAVGGQLAAAQPQPLLVLEVEENLRTDADPQLARRLVEILLENAWKFSANAPAARIDMGATETDGERVFFVRDTGAGFDMAHTDKLFTPFGRLHTVGEFPGIGIGLATAKRIVQRHSGRIWGDGHVGQGANFYFTLQRGLKRGTE